ncbi:DUF421 domain-containing protein [Subdoligranulum sp. DSM 109015]|uniref:DUF421 domain-containing protein n=1 Tax=Gemmiger gallinarum TaxID=2779354 RepID=A0ABR9R0T5_9FIRM|nr:YetF domain-containing protein [Gemmiger gallinarum]MBE5036714.1 DUF421 domain-containing protein [Gemmiger gallinarum]
MLSSITRTLVIYIVAIAAMRLMGKRQLAELQPSELVTTFLISNVASICIDEPELPLFASLTPILLITALEIFNSTLAWYCPRYARLLFGNPVTVIRNGVVDQEALRHLRITPNDLAESLREAQVFSPGDVIWGVIESNGSLSVAKKPEGDEPPPMLPILIDRHLYRDNLEALGFDDSWLEQQLSEAGIASPQVLILLSNGKETVLIPKKAAPKGGQN